MAMMTGRAILGHPGIMNFIGPNLGTEIIYSFVIILCSLMIYFGTKELYELSNHKGIKYFRQAFLFFAIAYFCRSFIKLALFNFNTKVVLDICPRLFGIAIGQATMFIFMYLSSMAIFYLLYSVMWKKLEKKPNTIYIFHLLAIIIALFSTFPRNPIFYLGLNLLLFAIVLTTVYLSRKNRQKKGHNLYTIYILLSFFWILNIIDILIPNMLQTLQLFIYLASIAIFLIMLYKVLKKTGTN